MAQLLWEVIWQFVPKLSTSSPSPLFPVAENTPLPTDWGIKIEVYLCSCFRVQAGGTASANILPADSPEEPLWGGEMAPLVKYLLQKHEDASEDPHLILSEWGGADQ